MRPKKITAGIQTQQLGADTLLMNEQTCDVHCLNQIASLVYQYADGERTPEAISDFIVENDGITCTVEAVEIALEQLAEQKLVEAVTIPEQTPEREIARREALKKLAAMAAVPVILSLCSRTAQAVCDSTEIGRSPSSFGERIHYRETCTPDDQMNG